MGVSYRWRAINYFSVAPLKEGVWWKMMRGLTTGNCAAVTKTFRQAYGVEKSAVSERFVQASKEKLRELLEQLLADWISAPC
jgi:putative transposase